MQSACQKKEKKSGASSKPKTSKQNFPCHLAFPTTKLAFLENMTSDTERRNALLVSECLLRCLTTALRGCDRSILEVCEEKISCRSGTASIMALQCWKRKVLRWGRYPFPTEKAGEAQTCCTFVCVHACAAQACIKLEMFSCPSLCLQWFLPTLLSVFLTIISPGTWCFSSWVGSDIAVIFLGGGHFPFHWMETAEAYKSLLSE